MRELPEWMDEALKHADNAVHGAPSQRQANATVSLAYSNLAVADALDAIARQLYDLNSRPM